MSLHLNHSERTAAQDNPADLAREIRQFHATMMENAKAPQPEHRNGIVVPSLMFRFALKDRIDRLCAALDVDAPLTPNEICLIEAAASGEAQTALVMRLRGMSREAAEAVLRTWSEGERE